MSSDSIEAFEEQFSKFNEQLFATDFCFLVGKDKVRFPVHKMVLHNASSFFAKLFETDITEYSYPQYTPEVFKYIVKYWYVGSKAFSSTQFKDVPLDTCFEFLRIAIDFKIQELKNIAIERIEENSDMILKSEAFLGLDEGVMMALLESDYFTVSSEYELFERSIRWLQNRDGSKEEIEKLKRSVMKNIRFTLFSLNELDIVEKMQVLTDKELKEIYKCVLKQDLENPRGALKFVHQTDFDTNGICYYLGCNDRKNRKLWANPMIAGELAVTCWNNIKLSGSLCDLVGRNQSLDLWLSASTDSAFVIDFINWSVQVEAYTLRSFSQTCCYMKGWNLEGSNDQIKWTILSTVTENIPTSLPSPNVTKTFTVSGAKGFYRYMRVHQVTANSSNWNFGLGGFEIYGQLKNTNKL
jgi:hypothetical protein